MERDLFGKVAIVTGGARGIGAATAEVMAAAGAAVVVTDVLDEDGERVASHLRDGGYTARYEHLDVSDEADWDRVVEKTVAELGDLHVLVNNAGIGTMSTGPRPWLRRRRIVVTTMTTRPVAALRAARVPAANSQNRVG